MKYKIGRNNLAATIYVPYDCQNNCPFCTSKKEYSCLKMDENAVVAALQKLVKNPNIKDIVFTGGEPTANIALLNKMVDIAKYKNVYINTTLPQKNFFGALEILNGGNVTGVNVSRHGISLEEDEKLFRSIVDDWAFNGINIPVKINVVLTEKNTVEDVQTCIDRWKDFKNVTVCFRRDFRKTTRETLHSLSGDKILDWLIDNYEFESHTFCDVCDTVSFVGRISFHRGLEHSSLKIGDTVIVNDIIVFPDGFVAYDWDRKPITELQGFMSSAKSIQSTRTNSKPISSKPHVPTSSTSSYSCFPGASCGSWSGHCG